MWGIVKVIGWEQFSRRAELTFWHFWLIYSQQTMWLSVQHYTVRPVFMTSVHVGVTPPLPPFQLQEVNQRELEPPEDTEAQPFLPRTCLWCQLQCSSQASEGRGDAAGMPIVPDLRNLISKCVCIGGCKNITFGPALLQLLNCDGTATCTSIVSCRSP